MKKMIHNNVPFCKFSSCFIVKGASRSLIYDIQRQDFQFIPNALSTILKNFNGQTISAVKKEFNKEHHSTIDEYFKFLLDEEYIFFTETPELFPEINLKWEEPSEITNAIIDLNDSSPQINWKKFFKELSDLACKHIQIRSFGNHDITYFEDVMYMLNKTRIVSVDLIIKFKEYSHEELLKFCGNFFRISNLTCHSAPIDKLIYHSPQNMGHIFFQKEKISDSSHCGMISPEYFHLNMKLYTESQNYNSCLNRKISIDASGLIRNCPSMKESFGKIHETSLREVVQKTDFKKYWKIRKDDIIKCKDCEFRHMCTDCRAYIDEPTNESSAPLKCGYNPYKCEWEDWSKNPLKDMAKEFYGFQ